MIFMEDRCVMCGCYVVEGRQVCKECEMRVLGDDAVKTTSLIERIEEAYKDEETI